jgi:hypothetical protein
MWKYNLYVGYGAVLHQRWRPASQRGLCFCSDHLPRRRWQHRLRRQQCVRRGAVVLRKPPESGDVLFGPRVVSARAWRDPLRQRRRLSIARIALLPDRECRNLQRSTLPCAWSQPWATRTLTGSLARQGTPTHGPIERLSLDPGPFVFAGLCAPSLNGFSSTFNRDFAASESLVPKTAWRKRCACSGVVPVHPGVRVVLATTTN